MIDRETSLYHLLQGAALFTDWAAQEVVAVDLPPRRQNLRQLVSAVAGLFAVRDRLLARRPDLRPPETARADADTPGEVYTAGNPLPDSLQARFELDAAVRVLEGFACGHNRELAQVARAALPALRQRLEQA